MLFKTALTRMGFLFLLLMSLAACKKEQSLLENESDLFGQSAANGGATTRNINFGPLLPLSNCLGYDIKVTVQAVEILETTVSTTGRVHYTRHWRVNGLSATSVGVTPVKNFDLVAGAEMFSIVDPNSTASPSAPSSGNVFIHQGTMVFENTETGERIVARHQILKNPGQGIFRSGWFINGQRCG